MMTFLVILLGYLLVSWVITNYRNGLEIKRAAAVVRQISQPYPFPILMPVYGRPHYLKAVIEALAQVKDIDKTILIISQDGSDPEVTELISQIDFSRTLIIKHTRPFLGILSYFWDSLSAASTNIYFLLEFTFSKTEARGAIVLEDDILPSVDFYHYFQWTFSHVFSNQNVLSVTGFNLDSRIVPAQKHHPQDYPYDLLENREKGQAKFTSWSWGITKEQWQQVRKRWSFTSWDIGLDKLQHQLRLISYKPVLGRVRNIGMQGGINFTEAEDNPKWRDIFIVQQSYDYPQVPRLHTGDDFIKLSYPEACPQPYHNEKTRTGRNRLWLLVAVILMCMVEINIFFWR